MYPLYLYDSLVLALSYWKCKSLYEMPDEGTAVRETYGVTFHKQGFNKQGISDNAHSVWHQTFVVPEEVTSLPDVHLYCEKLSQDLNSIYITLHNVCPALKAYHEQHYQLSQNMVCRSVLQKKISRGCYKETSL